MKLSSIGIMLLTSILCFIPIESQELIGTTEKIANITVIDEQIVIEDPLSEQIAMPIQEVIIEETSSNRWDIKLTDDEIDMLAKIIFLEAHLEPDDGISAAIEVVFNRMISKSFPDTLEEVLSQPRQFVTWDFIEKGKPTDKEYNMIYAALNGEKEVLTTEYVYFARGKQNDRDPVKIGDHWFCKE